MFALIPLFTGLFLLSKSAQASTPTNYTTQKVSAPIPERKPIQISEFNIDLSGLFASFRRLFDFSAQNTTPNGNDLMTAARPILDMIGRYESGGDYNRVYGNVIQPLTSMTLSQVIGFQNDYVAAGSPSSAVGKYQFIRKTLRSLKSDLGFSDSTYFNAYTQDTMALELLKRRGFKSFIEGRITMQQFMLNISMEWASLPVPFTTRGYKKTVQRGESYYAGDGLNTAHASTAAVESALTQARGLA